MEKIEVRNVSKKYIDQKGDSIQVLDHVSLDWKVGENISIIGESGSGKSTLARIVLGIEHPDQGNISLNGQDVTHLNFKKMRINRKILQGVFQDASGTLNSKRTVFQNVEEALCNLTDLCAHNRKKRIGELMEMTQMKQELMEKSVKQLSGGEQRRVALLRVLSLHPQYLVLDEVTSGLDLLSREAVFRVLCQYHQEYGCSYLMMTHQLDLAYRISDKIYKMEKGAFTEAAKKT
ncbi:MAG: ATP-binding cassette domain-containing protein [Lachnospiraceae bacterium]